MMMMDDENQHLLGTYHKPATLDTLHKMFHSILKYIR